MTTTPQDPLRRFVENLDCECDPEYSHRTCGRCLALAASAQVREVEALQSCTFDHPADWPCAICKPEAEPPLVAQGEVNLLLSALRRDVVQSRGGLAYLANAANLIEQQQATIADHARRDACWDSLTDHQDAAIAMQKAVILGLEASLAACRADAERLDYIERTFSGMTNRERYLPAQMIWGKGAMGRSLREACDKYMKREAAPPQASWDTKALEVARRFTADDEPQCRAGLQCAVLEAMQWAIAQGKEQQG